MNKKGFTLIEALAVIIILALISVIAIPSVTRLIENTKRQSFVTSIENLIESFESLNNEGEISGNTYDSLIATSELLPLNVNNFESGQVLYDEEAETKVEFVTNGDYCASGTLENLQVSKGGCAELDNSGPIITKINVIATSGTIRLIVYAHDPESGIKGISYSLNGTDFTQISNDYTIMGLAESTTYNVAICVTNGKDMHTEEVKTVITKSLAVPTITLVPAGWQQSKLATITFPQGNYIYSYNKDGTGWETVTEETKEITFTQNGYLIARVSDGVNKLDSVALNVQQIDTDMPTCQIKVANSGSWKTSKVLTITATDGTSGVYGIKKPNALTYTAGSSTTYTATESGLYTAIVMDNAGRTSNCFVNVSRIDATPPRNVVVAVQSRTADTITVEASASDNESGIAKYEYKIDTGSYINGGSTNTYAFLGANPGSHQIRVRVTNGVGLVTESAILNVAVIEATAPTLEVSTEDWAKNKEVTIIFPPRQSSYSYQYRKNSGSWITVSSGVTEVVEFTANGTVDARVLVAGIAPESPESLSVTKIDNTAPAVPTYLAYFTSGGASYTSGTWTRSEVYTRVSTSDSGSGVQTIQYSMDQVNWQNFGFGRSSGLVKSGSNAYGEEAWSLMERNNTYYFRAIDALGNVSGSSSSFNIRYDLTSPTCSVAGPYTTSTGSTIATYKKSGDKIYYQATCLDSNGINNGIAASEISRSNTTLLTGVTLENTASVSGGQKYTLGVNIGSGNGTASISMGSGTVSDSSGNTNTSGFTSSAITVDNTKPTCSWAGPAKSTIDAGASTTYTLTCSDAIGIGNGNYGTNISSYISTTSGLEVTSVTRGGGATSYVYTVTVRATSAGTKYVSLGANAVGDYALNYNNATGNSNALYANSPLVTGAGIFSSNQWSSLQLAYWTMSYDYQREGTSMKYRFRWNVWLSSSGGWYYNAMVIPITLNGTVVETIRVKYYESGVKGWNYSGITGWHYVANKTSGSTPFIAELVDKGGTYEANWNVKSTQGTHYLAVSTY